MKHNALQAEGRRGGGGELIDRRLSPVTMRNAQLNKPARSWSFLTSDLFTFPVVCNLYSYVNRSFNLKLVTLDLVRSGVGSHLFITRGSSLWSRFIGYNETIDIDHGSVKLASQSLDSSFNASPPFFVYC